MAKTAIRLPDITKTPATSTNAKASSKAWNRKSPEACSGAITNSITMTSKVSAVKSRSLHCSRKRAMRSFIKCGPISPSNHAANELRDLPLR